MVGLTVTAEEKFAVQVPHEAMITPEGAMTDDEQDVNTTLGEDLQAEAADMEPGALLFPTVTGRMQLRAFWHMRRRHRPIAPPPSRTPPCPTSKIPRPRRRACFRCT